MQSHSGAGTCNSDRSPFTVQNPCPNSMITQMIRDGCYGIASGLGLRTAVDRVGGKGAEELYKAARVYNSGSIIDTRRLEVV
ncbi:hypothetical protein AJ80_06680 [Polytolypa hystricis UAMH7299]|uniref:Uncharacterized protein n=1 Tax=Polytolypa hystricis (strain UAMH7299) TaxID=1447883 RepID=A0A2B7XU80_POLH7|nr:hypothetical protein AJ80_06680 [Polytolypa hystricis UAMH7299]